MSSVVTPDGGSAEILTPDGQRISLTIPAGCVHLDQQFTLTIITNLAGVPFSHGLLSAVGIEPEDLAH